LAAVFGGDAHFDDSRGVLRIAGRVDRDVEAEHCLQARFAVVQQSIAQRPLDQHAEVEDLIREVDLVGQQVDRVLTERRHTRRRANQIREAG
jgi:hypothetical protein